MHFMNLRFDRKLKKVIMERLSRLPPVGYANDIETGAFEVADSIVTASEHLLAKVPDAQTWFIRIGHQAVYHFGARSLKKSV
jgi:hypothetical protein